MCVICCFLFFILLMFRYKQCFVFLHRSIDYILLKYSKEGKLVLQQEFCSCIVEPWGLVNNVPMD